MTLGPVQAIARAGILAAALLVGACASDVNPVRDVFTAVGAGPKEATAPDFVAQSRPQRKDFMPIGVNAPPRTASAKTSAQVKQSEAELDALRAANAARGTEAQQVGAQQTPAAPATR